MKLYKQFMTYSSQVYASMKRRENMVKAMLVIALAVLVVPVVAHADTSIDFTATITEILTYIGAAFTAVSALLAIIYGAPLAWRFLKKFK